MSEPRAEREQLRRFLSAKEAATREEIAAAEMTTGGRKLSPREWCRLHSAFDAGAIWALSFLAEAGDREELLAQWRERCQEWEQETRREEK